MPEFPKLGELCDMLSAQEGVERVTPGRQAVESRVVSQDLEMFMPKAAAEDGCVRSGELSTPRHISSAEVSSPGQFSA